MANIQRVITGRHIWKEITLMRGSVRVPGSLICTNCRKPYFADEGGSPPLAGCSSDIDVSRLGDERLRDYRDQEMKVRADTDKQDIEFLRSRGLVDKEEKVC